MVMAKGVVGEGASGVRRSVTQPHLESLQDAVEAERSVERWVWGGYVKKKKVKQKLWAEEGAWAT